MIEKIYNEAILKKDAASYHLVSLLLDIDKVENFDSASIYHHFPIYPNQEGTTVVTANILLVSREFGIIIFQSVHNNNRLTQEALSAKIDQLKEIDRVLFAKIFKDAPKLQSSRRALKFEIFPCLYIHEFNGDFPNVTLDNISTCTSKEEILDLIHSNRSEISPIDLTDLKATIEGSKGIIRPADRVLKDAQDFKNSKGAILAKIESAIYNFDLEQKRAALFILDGPQRIRGLAGSGKTIILTMKAAQIHLQNPNAEILYTYYTKNLFDLVKRLITRFYRQFAEKDPNWDKIHIMHAWGGAGLEGVYSNACVNNNIRPLSLIEAKRLSNEDPFGVICSEVEKFALREQYDFALLDEAQDFPSSFYRLCRKLTRNNRVIWAYDDFQNILNITLQSEKETFGKDSSGRWHIDFEGHIDEMIQDLILHKCYRNPKAILIAAFSLGLGIYNYDVDQKRFRVLQRLENNEHWESLGFTVEKGDSKDGSEMILSRPDHNSSELKNTLLPDNIIKIAGFESLEKEVDFVANQIIGDLKSELNPEDISVICVDDRYAKSYFSTLNTLLNKANIKTFNHQGEPPDTKIFKVKGYVTLSTIYKAKGNETGSVYIVGVDTIFDNKNDITQRNKLFTAMTRSIGWVYLTGLASKMSICMEEFDRLIKNDFKLLFIQPSELEVKTIRQDIGKKEAAYNNIERIADKLSKDLNIPKEEIVEDLRRKFNKKKSEG